MYREEGVLTVEMEPSALFSVARASGVEAAALFTVSDVIDVAGWVPRSAEAPSVTPETDGGGTEMTSLDPENGP